MNIFILDEDPGLAAIYQCDKHVVKMCLETAQIMSTVLDGPYKPTHIHHPCVKWAAENATNMDWLCVYGVYLCQEYERRYEKQHKCLNVIRSLGGPVIREKLPPGDLTPFVQCMPDIYRCGDPVIAYRRYYHSKTFATWKHSLIPHWWQDTSYLINTEIS